MEDSINCGIDEKSKEIDTKLYLLTWIYNKAVKNIYGNVWEMTTETDKNRILIRRGIAVM